MLRFLPSCIMMFILVAWSSCGTKDNPDSLIHTQFASEVIDSCHILSPKTYSYLHNIKPPLGVKPVIVAVEKIDISEMGSYADCLFNRFCEKKYSGNTFSQRGILIVASKEPELIQVRVGKTYAIYCRMRGSAAGEGYLAMQKETASRGIDEMCPVALQNVIEDIEGCRQLPWYKKFALKISFLHLDIIMEDLATPSESFFNQFYFRPFLFIVGGIRSILRSWLLSFIFIALTYTLVKNRIERKTNDFISRKAKQDSCDDEDYVLTHMLYNAIKMAILFIVKLLITIPTLAAISVLSTSRTEDIIALSHANIPSVDLMDTVTHWTNNTTELWLVLLLMTAYYVKFIICDQGMFVLGSMPDQLQQSEYNNNRKFGIAIDMVVRYGYNRSMIQTIAKNLVGVLINAIHHQNFQEMDPQDIGNDSNETDKDGQPKKRLIDYLFLDTSSSLFKQAPCLAVQVNTHREALCMTAFVGIIATVVLSYTYALYFLALWLVQFALRMKDEYLYARKREIGFARSNFQPFRLLREVWKTDVICLAAMCLLFLVIAPSYSPKTMERIEAVQHSLPEDLSGLYFVTRAEGTAAKGVTAKLTRRDSSNYIMQVHSDQPVRRYALTLDAEGGLFHCDILGDGYITYDEQTRSTTINFSDLWVLTN